MTSDYNFFVRRYGLYILKPTQRSLLEKYMTPIVVVDLPSFSLQWLIEMAESNGREIILPDRIKRNIFYEFLKAAFSNLYHMAGWVAG
jgi:hypothetical protein